jgi:hypothetical protein
LKLDQCARRVWGEFVGEPIPFGSFLERNQKYKQVCGGFSEPFNLLLVTALDYCHQIDLHLMQQQTGQLDSEELESAQQILSNCMDYILPHVEETYAEEVYEAFDAFKQQHGNDEPVSSLSEFRGLSEAFLGVVEKERNSPLPTNPQEQNLFLNHLSQKHPALSWRFILFAESLTPDERNLFDFFIKLLDLDKEMGFSYNLQPLTTNSTDRRSSEMLEITNAENSSLSDLMDALRRAYVVYRLELSLAHGPSIER